MSTKRRGSKTLKRTAGARPERRTIVVFCEGKVTEPDYLKGIKRLPGVTQRAAVHIEIDTGHGVPLTLVERSVARKEDPEVDECWCVFDVEWPNNHPNLSKAVELAQAYDIGLAISNPCFELWLLLHHQDYNKFSDSAAVERQSKIVDGRAGKGINAEFYIPLRKNAVRRAHTLAERHQREGRAFPHDNPSSSMPGLLRALEMQDPRSTEILQEPRVTFGDLA